MKGNRPLQYSMARAITRTTELWACHKTHLSWILKGSLAFQLARTWHMPGMVWSGYSDGDIRRQTQGVIGEKGPGLTQRALYAILEVWNLPLSGNGPQETQ